jgi:hypothetical protein
MTLDEFRAHLAREGFTVPEDRLEELHAALPLVNAMRQRMRRAYGYGDEPALIFEARK